MPQMTAMMLMVAAAIKLMGRDYHNLSITQEGDNPLTYPPVADTVSCNPLGEVAASAAHHFEGKFKPPEASMLWGLRCDR